MEPSVLVERDVVFWLVKFGGCRAKWGGCAGRMEDGERAGCCSAKREVDRERSAV